MVRGRQTGTLVGTGTSRARSGILYRVVEVNAIGCQTSILA